MEVYQRQYQPILSKKLTSPYVHILFGARQTGKSTLIRRILPEGALAIDLADPAERARFAASPGLFTEACRALPRKEGGAVVFVDEAQTVPAIFDSVQSLYDADKERFRFILCGSSARRLRATGANLLPGRSIRHLLHPLVAAEYEEDPSKDSGVAAELGDARPQSSAEASRFPWRSIESRLVFGDLPGIALAEGDETRADLLRTYATSYLEEEIRRETIMRNWGRFLRFLRFAAAESGGIVNYQAVSRETGLQAQTIKSYYQLLEDMFVGFQVRAFSGSARKSVLSSPRFFLFDNGLRNAAAGLPLAEATVNADPGRLFEHWIGCQLWRRLSYEGSGSLSYFRTSDGAEIDFIVERRGVLLPIEVKWTEAPSAHDARHLRSFMREHRDTCPRALIVSRCPYRLAIDEGITAIPWWQL